MELGTLIRSLGYPGIFFSSLLASLVPFLPLPYLLTLRIVVDALGLSPIASALFYALGSTLGKLPVFAAGRGGRRLLTWETRQRIEPLAQLLNRHAWLPFFAEALLPLPDDIYLLPLGVARFGWARYFLVIPSGKFVRALAALTLFGFFFRPIERHFHGLALGVIFGAIYAVFAAFAVVAVMRVDWRRLLMGGNRLNKPSSGEKP